MIRGMTGHGRGEAQVEGLRASADVRTVNHRHLDVEVRGPLTPALEAQVRTLAEQRLARGKVDVAVALEAGSAAAPVRVNRAVLHAVVAELRDLGREVGASGELTLDHLAVLPWARVLEAAAPELSVPQSGAVLSAVRHALDGVVLLREREGREIATDLRARLASLRSHLSDVRTACAGAPAAHLERLRARLSELLAGAEIDRDRLAQEAAALADKSDASEEIVRLLAYLDRLDELVEADGPTGKRLEFTLQEALREANTVGAKVRSFDVGRAVIEIKSELERMREQAANVE
jgi:uncharacterized protein (TIGR00255 family)